MLVQIDDFGHLRVGRKPSNCVTIGEISIEDVRRMILNYQTNIIVWGEFVRVCVEKQVYTFSLDGSTNKKKPARLTGRNLSGLAERPVHVRIKAEWDELAARPKFQRLRKSIPIMAVWDNHDYGTHDGGAEFALKETSKQIFLDFFGEPAGSPRRKRAGIYDAKIFGRVQVILLDTRSFKGPYVLKERSGRTGSMGKYAPNPDPSVTLLGAEQWRWLEARLREPAEVRLVASSTQVIPDQKGMDEWGNYPHERRRLLDLLMGANGVLLLSGNVHFAEISGFETLVEFTSSGLTHTNKEYAAAPNRYRVTGPYTEINFGLVEIDWSRRRITLRAVGANGSRAFEHQVSLDSLQPEE